MDLAPFHRRPTVRTVVGLCAFGGLYLAATWLSGPAAAYDSWLQDLLVALVALLLMSGLTAQFVLPVRTWRERRAAIRRLLAYLVGERGPVVFVREGSAVEGHEERKRKGPGVILVDHASAAVLRTDTKFTRAVGPGVVFTDSGERLAEALDLRKQSRMLRGAEPVTGQAMDSSSAPSMAVTKDGIPISADIALSFVLDPGHTSELREGRLPHMPPYEFNRVAAERAVFGHVFGQQQDAAWSDLPLRLAVDLWREIVKEVRLKDLLSEEMSGVSHLDSIAERIQARLTTGVMRRKGPRGELVAEANPEYELLSKRGIRVLAVEVRNVYLPSDIREERLRRWSDTWAAFVREALTEGETAVREARRRGEAEGAHLLSQELTAGLRASLARQENPDMQATLKLTWEDALRVCARQVDFKEGPTLASAIRRVLEEQEQQSGNEPSGERGAD